MARTTKVRSASLPPEIDAELERVMKEEYITFSRLVQQLLLWYFRRRSKLKPHPGGGVHDLGSTQNTGWD
jgi:hypothetical protein